MSVEKDLTKWLDKIACDDPWNSGNLSAQLQKETLSQLAQNLLDLNVNTKLKLLLAFVHLPKRVIESWQDELREILSIAVQDTDDWVQFIAEVLSALPDEHRLAVEGEGGNDTNFSKCLSEIRQIVRKHDNGLMNLQSLPIDASYMNKNALSAVQQATAQASKLFTLKRKSRSVLLRVDILQKSREAKSKQSIASKAKNRMANAAAGFLSNKAKLFSAREAKSKQSIASKAKNRMANAAAGFLSNKAKLFSAREAKSKQSIASKAKNRMANAAAGFLSNKAKLFSAREAKSKQSIASKAKNRMANAAAGFLSNKAKLFSAREAKSKQSIASKAKNRMANAAAGFLSNKARERNNHAPIKGVPTLSASKTSGGFGATKTFSRPSAPKKEGGVKFIELDETPQALKKKRKLMENERKAKKLKKEESEEGSSDEALGQINQQHPWDGSVKPHNVVTVQPSMIPDLRNLPTVPTPEQLTDMLRQHQQPQHQPQPYQQPGFPYQQPRPEYLTVPQAGGMPQQPQPQSPMMQPMQQPYLMQPNVQISLYGSGNMAASSAESSGPTYTPLQTMSAMPSVEDDLNMNTASQGYVYPQDSLQQMGMPTGPSYGTSSYGSYQQPQTHSFASMPNPNPVHEQQQDERPDNRHPLKLTREQMAQAQDLFKSSNKLSRPEKALILGFMAGKRGYIVMALPLGPGGFGDVPGQVEDHDDDDVDETLTERLVGLTEMFPQSVRKGTCSLASNAYSLGCVSLAYGRKALWIASTTATILLLPYLFERERLEMQEAQAQHERQVLLGPHAAMSGMKPQPV